MAKKKKSNTTRKGQLYGTLVIRIPIHAVQGNHTDYLNHLEDSYMEHVAKRVINYAKSAGDVVFDPDLEFRNGRWCVE